MISFYGLGLVLLLIAALAWRLAVMCPSSEDGRHAFTRETDRLPDGRVVGMHVRCTACGMKSSGVPLGGL